jgi:protein TonB
MQEAVRTRAISFAAASGLCAMALIAALGMKFHYAISAPPDTSGPIDGYVEEPPEPPPPEPRPDRERQTLEHDWLDPLPIDNDAAPERLVGISIDAPPRPWVFAGGPPEITNPHWLNRPRDLSRYYPPRALRRSIEGHVRIDCVVDVSGWLTNCTVLEETPADWGFGQAALRIAREHRMSPALRDGVPVTARYRMIVPFGLE